MKNFYPGNKSTSLIGYLTGRGKFILQAICIAVLIILAVHPSFGQVVITQEANSQNLAQLLGGTGVTISNYSKTCDNNGTATFTSGASTLGIGQGIILASGKVQSIAQAANNFASNQFTNTTDAQLSTLTSGAIYDKCILEFDIVPQGSTLKFDYVFASEEYPEFVCSPYNDVFGFFISGPNPGGGNYTNKNLATLPNSSTPVCINTVNPGVSGTYQGNTWNAGNCQSLSNTGSYVNNLSPVNSNIVYDGMTAVLTASANVVPCQTYHLKIAIADVGDRIYDSGVFLQAYSFTSTPYSISIAANLNYPGYTSAFEGCVNGSYTVSLSAAQSAPITVNLVTSGTATSGSDYTALPTSVVIPAGQTSVTFPLTTILDNITEAGGETVTVSLANSCAGTLGAAATITIMDNPVPGTAVGDTTLCRGQSTQISASGATSYSWSPAAGLSNPNIANPIATPTATTTYTVTATLGSCAKTISAATIVVSNLSAVIISAPKDTICNGGTIQLTATPSNGITPYTYKWNDNSTANTKTASSSGTYSITATDAFGCTASTSKSVIISNLSLAGTITHVSCFGNTNGAINTTVTGANSPYSYHWGDGPGTQNRSGLAGGTYTITVQNSVACSATASYTVVQPTSALAATAAPSAASCNTTNTGGIVVTPSGGVPPYRYLWNNNTDTTKDRTNLSANSYTVTITDAGNCTISKNATVTEPSAIGISETHTNENCFGGNNGSINITATGGTGAYTYGWNNSKTTQNVNTLTAGSYTVTVKDANNCQATKTIAITEPTAVSATATGINPTCNGLSNGSVSLSVSGGTAGYTYLWSNNATSQNIASLPIGTYTATVTDSKGCTDTAIAVLNQLGNINPSVTKTDVSCFGGNNGSITLTVSGGTQPFTYNWGAGITTQNRINLTAGNYTVTVTDSISCTATISSSIAQPAQALAASGIPVNVLCFGENTGAINLNVAGGTSPYTYNWGSSITTQNRSGLAAGTFTVTVTDAKNCTSTNTTVISQPTALSAGTTATAVSCFGGTNGSITTTTTGGTTPYTYKWNDNTTTANRTNIPAGNYQILVTDSNQCTATATAIISQPLSALNAATVPTNVSCYGGNTGRITLTVSGGTGGYAYNWGNNITTQNRSNLTAGSYSVTVSDTNSCSTTASVTITQPGMALAASLPVTPVSCFGGSNGSINLSANGGTAPYTYNWGSGITSPNRTNLAAGSYTVTITDSKSCSITASATIAQPASALNPSHFASNVSCYNAGNGSIVITVSGGTPPFTYNWGNGVTSKDRNNLPSGTYSVIVTDSNACSATIAATLTQPSAALSSAYVVNPVTCYGGSNASVNITASGGTLPYSYDWGNNVKTNSRSNLSAGNYVVTVNDAKGCVTTSNITISQPQTLSVNIKPKNVSCFGGADGGVAINISGGTVPYTYKWNNGTTNKDLQNVTIGTYSLQVVDSNNCTTSTSVSITQPTALQVSGISTDVKCFGENTGNVSVNVAGGTVVYKYDWSNGATTQNLTGVKADSYTLTVTDANACKAMLTKVIAQPVAITVNETHTDIPCYGGSNGKIDVSATGGTGNLTYAWDKNAGSSQHLTTLVAGTYTLTVTDSNTCTSNKVVVIAQPPLLKPTETHTDLSCNKADNGSITISVTGGIPAYRYNWGTGDTVPYLSGLKAGQYSVTVSDAHGCHSSLNAIILGQPDSMTATINPTDVVCFGTASGKADATITGGTKPYYFNWSNNSRDEDLLNVVQGSYQLTVTDVNGCSQTGNTTIGTLPGMLTSVSAEPLACANAFGSINFDVTGGTAPYSYAWNNGAHSQNLDHIHPGNYTVTVQDANGCILDTTIKLANLNNLEVKASGGGTIKLGETVELIATSTGSSQTTYVWSPTYNISCAECPKTVAQPGEYTLYTVVATDTNGCVAKDTVSVDILGDHTLFTPNAFTPNDDGNNDNFKIFGNLDAIRKIEVAIYDRWGEKVFESEKPEFEWDGTYKGEKMQPGVFVYILKLAYLDGSDKMQKGSVTLIR